MPAVPQCTCVRRAAGVRIRPSCISGVLMRNAGSRLKWMSLIVAVALASCSGGSASLPVTTGDTTALAPLGFASTVTPMAAVNTSPGKVNGLDNQFSPTDGDTPAGGQGSIVDKKVP